MSSLQEWIHKLEEGIGARIIKSIALALGLLALAGLYDWREYKCFSNQDAMDMAQVARHVAEGKGYTTGFIRPLSLHLLQEKARREGRSPNEVLRDPHPDLANPPLYPFLLAGLMKVAPLDHTINQQSEFTRYQPEMWITYFNQVLFVLVTLLAFFLARRLFDPWVAGMTVVIFAGTDLLWRFSISGLPTLLLMLIFLSLVWCLVEMEQREREGTAGNGSILGLAAAVGALAGLGFLTRYAFGWILVPLVTYLMIIMGTRRAKVAAVVVITFLLFAAPWIARNWMVSGTPLGVAGYSVIQETPYFPGDRLMRTITPDFRVVMVEDYFRKLLLNLASIMGNDLPRLGGSWLTAFFLVGLLIPYMNPALNRLRTFAVLVFPVFAFAQALGRTHLSLENPELNSDQLLVVLVPVVFIFGIALINQLLDQIEVPFPPIRTWLAGAIALVASAPLIFTLLPPRTYPVAYPPYHPPLIQQSAGWLEEKELMMSDMPWAVAWYGQRDCLWNTLSVKPEFFDINDRQKNISAIYLTQLSTDAKLQTQMLRGEDYIWSRFYLDSLFKTNLPAGWPLRHAPAGFLEAGQMFITDRPRWKFPPRTPPQPAAEAAPRPAPAPAPK